MGASIIKMKTRFLIIIGIIFFSALTSESYAMCAAESLEWWEACNDTGPDNALPLNPILLFMVFPIVIILGVAGFIFWIKRK